MKKWLIPFAFVFTLACNNEKKETANETKQDTAQQVKDSVTNPADNNQASPTNLKVTIDNQEINLNGSILVTKDKDKLQPGADYLVMITSRQGPNQEIVTLNFLMDLKPDTYPVVGMALSRGPSENAQLYGGLMGGQPKLTNYKVTLTEVKKLGSNNAGGNEWSISGYFDDIVVPAMGIMLLDESKKHPKEVKLEKASFTNLTFNDNWEELMKKAVDQMKK